MKQPSKKALDVASSGLEELHTLLTANPPEGTTAQEVTTLLQRHRPLLLGTLAGLLDAAAESAEQDLWGVLRGDTPKMIGMLISEWSQIAKAWANDLGPSPSAESDTTENEEWVNQHKKDLDFSIIRHIPVGARVTAWSILSDIERLARMAALDLMPPGEPKFRAAYERNRERRGIDDSPRTDAGDSLLSYQDQLNGRVKALARHLRQARERPIAAPPALKEPSFKVEVLTSESTAWSGNAQRYPSRELAEAAGKDLFSRWMAVKEFRVVPSADPPNQGTPEISKPETSQGITGQQEDETYRLFYLSARQPRPKEQEALVWSGPEGITVNLPHGAAIDLPPKLDPNQILARLIAEEYLPKDAKLITVLPGEGP